MQNYKFNAEIAKIIISEGLKFKKSDELVAGLFRYGIQKRIYWSLKVTGRV